MVVQARKVTWKLDTNVCCKLLVLAQGPLALEFIEPYEEDRWVKAAREVRVDK